MLIVCLSHIVLVGALVFPDITGVVPDNNRLLLNQGAHQRTIPNLSNQIRRDNP